MKPGRELDAKIASDVMGWKFHPTLNLWSHESFLPQSPCVPFEQLPHYSTNFLEAWQVVEEFKECEVRVYKRQHGVYSCMIWFLGDEKNGEIYDADSSQSPAHAICLAALKAVEK